MMIVLSYERRDNETIMVWPWYVGHDHCHDMERIWSDMTGMKKWYCIIFNAELWYATPHFILYVNTIWSTMIWFIWYIMRWTIDWYEHSNCKYSIFILSSYTWMCYKYSQAQVVSHDLTARIQNTYYNIDTDHLWASRRPMPEGKFPRQACGINKNFPNNQSVP